LWKKERFKGPGGEQKEGLHRGCNCQKCADGEVPRRSPIEMNLMGPGGERGRPKKKRTRPTGVGISAGSRCKEQKKNPKVEKKKRDVEQRPFTTEGG